MLYKCFKPFSMANFRVKMKVEVPVSVAYGLYSERESIPKWMTFISSVKVMRFVFVHMTLIFYSWICF